MKLSKLLSLIFIAFSMSTSAMTVQFEFDNIPIGPDAGPGMIWELQQAPSDDFNYTFNPNDSRVNFGPSNNEKWYNTYHDQLNGAPNNFPGPGPTIWRPENLFVDGDQLNLFNTRVPNEVKRNFNGNISYDYVTRAACMTNLNRVIFPVFVEARVTVANSTAASDVWLLSPDDTEEIDIIETYGGPGVAGSVPGGAFASAGRNNFFAERIHLSHHVFIRSPFTDYQPRDFNSFWRREGVEEWGNRTVDVGVYWVSPTRMEYYIDGELARVLDNNAIASKVIDGSWEYTRPAGLVNAQGQTVNTNLGTNGRLLFDTGSRTGFQSMTDQSCSQSANFDESCLQAAKAASNISVLDPFNYLNNGRRFSKEMDIIINTEDQSFQADANPSRSPNSNEISQTQTPDQTMRVDWVRVYKPVNSIADRTRSLTFTNRDSFVSPDDTNPEFQIGENVPLEISYETGISDGAEEDLNYVAIQVREVDENGAIVGTSAFQVAIGGAEANTGENINYTYTIPTDFATGPDNSSPLTTPIPTTSNLDDGHELVLLIFMSVDGDAAFANANAPVILTQATLSNSEFSVEDVSVSIYPNPVSNILNIVTPFDDWKIYSLSGAIVKSGTENQIDVSNLSSGLYYISLNGNRNGNRFEKFIKK